VRRTIILSAAVLDTENLPIAPLVMERIRCVWLCAAVWLKRKTMGRTCS